MKKLHAGAVMFLGGFLALTTGAEPTTVAREAAPVLVGTFDSRAVAVAYVQSDGFREYLGAQHEDIERALARARAAGDDGLVEGLESLGPMMQARLHEQGFGTAPVDDILALIEDAIPGIAAEAGVDVIVSKWALTHRGSTVEFVDVTYLIAAEFEPSERTLKMIQSTMEADPVPLDQLGDHED